MRKILSFFVMLILLFCISLNAKTIEVDPKIGACNLRDIPSISNSVILRQIYTGTKYEVVGEEASYLRVILTDKKTGEDFCGWIWRKTVRKTEAGIWIVIGKGATLRSKPKKDNKTVLSYIWPGSVISEILNSKISWYKIEMKNYTGWVHYSSLKK